ncbi:MAG: hypothetical protein HeimC3_21720 [Candidatus Heimdallarchaeota archaeon LC_3]|nr:MAG: hypothetical protein HeimC3_21720 [Candidatus Heimdallarchaeota archaeon LC_3]
MQKINSFLLGISFFFFLITNWYFFLWPSFDNPYDEPILVGVIILSFPFITFTISFISFFLFAKHYIGNYINGFAKEMVESYTDEISDPIENNL